MLSTTFYYKIYCKKIKLKGKLISNYTSKIFTKKIKNNFSFFFSFSLSV